MSSFNTGLYGNTLSSILGNVNDAFSGKTTGINVSTVVSELMEVERQPETVLQNQQATINSQVSALTSLGTQLSTLQDSVNSLTDILGAFSQMTTGTSDSAIVSATADNTATAGTHTIVVSKLATTSSSYSDYIPSGTSLAGAQIVVNYGSDPNNPVKTDTINIPSSATTLQKAVSSINSGSYGVTASVVTDSTGSQLVFVSKTSGVAGNLNVSSTATNFTSAAGIDAQFTVDGVPVDSGSNTISASTSGLTGVTLSLGEANVNTPVLLSVQPDTTQASTAIQSFVTAYNAVVSSINSQYTTDANGDEGVLSGDSMLRSLQSELLGMAAGASSGTGQYVNLQSMGIEMQDDGTLQINSANLSQALSSNFSAVQSFFQSTSGWGHLASTQMQGLTDPTLGPVGADITGLTSTNQSLTNQINDFEVQMTAVQQQLTTEYSNLNALLEQYPMMIQQTAAQLSSLPSNTSNNNG